MKQGAEQCNCRLQRSVSYNKRTFWSESLIVYTPLTNSCIGLLGESVALIYVYAIAMSPYDITNYVTVKLVKDSHLFAGTMALQTDGCATEVDSILVQSSCYLGPWKVAVLHREVVA